MATPPEAISATLLKSPRKKEAMAGSTRDEAHCTLCDCSDFTPGKVATICTCGHHYEDHEIPESVRKNRSRT